MNSWGNENACIYSIECNEIHEPSDKWFWIIVKLMVESWVHAVYSQQIASRVGQVDGPQSTMQLPMWCQTMQAQSSETD